MNLIITKTTNIIIGAMHFQGNPYDGDTLNPTLNQVERLTGQRPAVAITDRGFRGRSKLGTTEVVTPVASKTGQTNYQKQKARIRFRRRAAIEPKISHLKADFRMGRNFLKGIPGDGINLLMAAAAANFKKLLTPGENRVKLKRGKTDLEINFQAKKLSGSFPAGQYRADVVLRCE